MALNPAPLVKACVDLFTSGAPVALVSAQRLSQAYASYATLALAGANLPIFTGAETLLMQGTLLKAMNPIGGLPNVFAQAWTDAFLAFWTSPPIQFVGPQAGAVTSAPGSSSLTSTLTQLFSNPLNVAQLAGTQLAMALDTATRTVLVTVAPPPGTILPVL